MVLSLFVLAVASMHARASDSVTTTSEPDQNTLNVQIEKLQVWNFSKYANCAVRDRPWRMGELPVPEKEYVVLAERALKIWYAALLVQPTKRLDISIHFWQFCFLTLFGLFFQVGFWCQKLCLGGKARKYSPSIPSEELDLVWHCHILDTRNYAHFLQQLGVEIEHIPFKDEETNDLAQYLGCFFPIFPNFTIHYIHIYTLVLSFFHLLIIFLSFLSAR